MRRPLQLKMGAANHSSREVEASFRINQPQVKDNYSIARDCPRREIRKSARYTDSEGLAPYALTVTEEIPEAIKPSTYTEAIFCPSSSNWVLAMQEEMESLHKNQTWDLCKLPKGCLLYTSPSPRDGLLSRMPSSA